MATCNVRCAAGPASEELPYTEEFFLPGSGATRGLTSQDLETMRTQVRTCKQLPLPRCPAGGDTSIAPRCRIRLHAAGCWKTGAWTVTLVAAQAWACRQGNRTPNRSFQT